MYVWDVRQRKCRHVFVDEGCIHSTALAMSPDGRYVACGSDSGVVNMYDTATCFEAAEPKPIKAVMNLTTSIGDLTFNHSRCGRAGGRAGPLALASPGPCLPAVL